MKSNGKRRPVAAIAGGTRGIGRAIAELFRKEGYAVAVCSRTAETGGNSPTFFSFPADVRRREEARQFVEAVLERFGSLDVFVNCAGVSRWKALSDIEEDFLGEILETNVMGTVWGCAAAASAMKRGGCIINVSSLAGKRGSARNSAYCAAKFAVNGLTQSLAKELGPRGLRVNAVCPVYVETDHILASLAEPASPAEGKGVKTYLRSFAKTQTALGRLPTALEVAETVLFLAGPRASAITGQCLNVDCGALPQ